jgi:hypothetical protein
LITESSRVPLARRAWIGDGTRGALVAADGTMDWYLPYRVGGGAACWRLLDPQGGAVRVGPWRESTGAARRLPAATQRYRGRSNVVETVIEGQGGRKVAVVDAWPWLGPGLTAPGFVLRLVEVLAGPIDVEVEVVPSGSWRPAVDVSVSAAGLVVDDVRIRCPIALEPSPLSRDEPPWRGVQRFDTGQALTITIGPVDSDATVTVDAARRIIAETELAWQSWLSPFSFDGPHAAVVERSLLAVRSLTGPDGAPLAAGTTSLPRRVGDEQTEDDRWVQVRQVAGAAGTLADVGLGEDAEAAEAWLRTALTDAPVPWPSWLDVDGQPAAELEELSLQGWRRTQPVVVGRPQQPPDPGLLGAVAAAVDTPARGPAGRRGAPGPLSGAWPVLREAADWTADHWADGELTSNRIDAWSGLDAMARRARVANPLDLDAVGWQQEARDIFNWLESNAVTAAGALVGGGPKNTEAPRADLLRVGWTGPWPATSPVVAATVDRVLERLTISSLVYRWEPDAVYDSPDLEASLWAVRALAVLGRWEEAHARIEAVVALTGPTNLLAQAADPVAGEVLGNLPSTAAGLAFIDAALALRNGPR